MKQKREIIFFRDYFLDFFNPLKEKVKTKIDYVLYLIVMAERIPK